MDKYAGVKFGLPGRAWGANDVSTEPARGATWLAARAGGGAPGGPDGRIESSRGGPGPRQRGAAEREAVRWLALIDAGLYEERWSSAAATLRSSFTREEWARTVRAARGGHGPLEPRELRAVELETALPGAPAGTYVVVHFETRRASEPPLREAVTLVETTGGVLLVTAYFFIA